MKDQRKSPRRSVRYPAWLAFDPGNKLPCSLADISDSGARVDIENPEAIPDQCVLLLSSNGAAKRQCRVVWREPNQVGLAFEQPVPDSTHAPLKPPAGA